MSNQPSSRAKLVAVAGDGLAVRLVAAVLHAWFALYDLVTYPLFQWIGQPVERVREAKAVKARPEDANDPSSPWRAVVAGTDEGKCAADDLYRMANGRWDKLWSQAAAMYSDFPCMGVRSVMAVQTSAGPDGRKMQTYAMAHDYTWSTYAQVAERVRHLGAGFSACGHLTRQPLVVFAETRAEWLQVALAAISYDFPVVTVYANLGVSAIETAINSTEASTIVTSYENLHMIKTYAAVLAPMPTPVAPTNGASAMPPFPYFRGHSTVSESAHPDGAGPSVTVMPLSAVENAGSSQSIEPPSHGSESSSGDDVALIMFTSGTTGPPKGVVITHGNLLGATSAQATYIPDLGPSDCLISYLPLAHILEIDCELAVLAHGGRIGYSSALTLIDGKGKIGRGCKGDITTLRPTLMACVPAIMDRLYKSVSERLAGANPLVRASVHVMYERRRARIESGYDDPFLNRLVFGRIRALLGGRVRLMLSGGAPLNAETQRFMNICFCCPVLQGYGLTETTGAATLSFASDFQTGHVGPPLVCNDIYLRDWPEGGYVTTNRRPQGEILIGGTNLARGYWRNEQQTRSDFIEHKGARCFATGDIGEFTEQGDLKIIDRKKDLVKLQHGEYVSLGRVETALKTHALAENVCVVAEGLETFCVALVVANEKALRQLAVQVGVRAASELSLEKLCAEPDLAEAVQKELAKHAAQPPSNLRKFEIPARVHLIAEQWAPGGSDALLTAAMKLKRQAIAARYKEEIKRLYGWE